MVASLTGLDVADLDQRLEPQVVSTGTAFAIVVLASADALSRLRLRQEEASQYLRAHGARWFYVLGPESEEHSGAAHWRARMQFNGGEDPATGSAAGCAISYLVRHGVVASGETIHVRQGVEMLRPSELLLSGRIGPSEGSVTDVRVGGSTVLVASGHLFLP